MTVVDVLTHAATALGGGTLTAVASAWARRGSSREASATAVVQPLLDRLAVLEARSDEDRARLDTCEDRHHECERRAARAEGLASKAHEHIAVLRQHISARDGAIADLRQRLAGRDADVTRRVQLAVERSITPTGTPRHTTSRDDEDTRPETPSARTLGRMTREIPAPRGAKEDR